MRLVPALALALLLAPAAPLPAVAQTTQVTAEIGSGRTAKVTANQTPQDGVVLEINSPGGLQRFPKLGTEIVAMNPERSKRGLFARDLDGDGIDEIIIRGLVPPDRGAVLVFRWDAGSGAFAPVTFTDDREQTAPYLVVDAALPVKISEDGMFEVEHSAMRQDGRRSYFVARYRWNGTAYTHFADN